MHVGTQGALIGSYSHVNLQRGIKKVLYRFGYLGILAEMDNKTVECAICLNPIEIEDNADLECAHDFHIECIKDMHDTVCPMCRADLKSKKLSNEDLLEMDARHREDIRANDEDAVAMHFPNDRFERLDVTFDNYNALVTAVAELDTLRAEFFRLADVNNNLSEIEVNQLVRKLEEELGLEIGYVHPHEVQRAKGVQYRYLCKLERDIARKEDQIAELQIAPE